jgi:predicted regulator of Ras-like GTPase activity (Roadblock/LC7/MglB family)
LRRASSQPLDHVLRGDRGHLLSPREPGGETLVATKEYFYPGRRMGTRLRGILQELVGEDTRAVAVVGLDGNVVEAAARAGAHDIANVATDLAAFLKVGAYCVRKLDGGDLDHLMVTTDSLTVLAAAMGPGHYLTAVLDAGANVARARVQVRRRKAEIVEALA